MHEYPDHCGFGAAFSRRGDRASGSLPTHVARKPAASQRGRRAGDASGKKGVEGCGGAAIRRRSGTAVETLALIEGLEFGDGIIEAEIAGDVRPGAPEAARGFVGIAFRVQSDLRTYDAFYLRPTNGRADDQVRRNHAAQYISHPDWPWFRLRKEFPSKYESYVDLVPGTWTKVKIEVRGEQARLFVHDMKQPTLIVNDVKSGANGKGAVALWIDVGTVAHFRNLTVSKK